MTRSHKTRGVCAGSGAGTSRGALSAPSCTAHVAEARSEANTTINPKSVYSKIIFKCCYINSPLFTPALRRWGRAHSRSSNYPPVKQNRSTLRAHRGGCGTNPGTVLAFVGPRPRPPAAAQRLRAAHS